MKVKKSMRMFFRNGYMIGLAILLCLNLGACGYKRMSYASAFEANWKIILPENLKVEFSEYEESFTGDGPRYAVLKAEEEPTEFLADFSKDKDAAFENKVNKILADTEFEIPENLLPDWGAVYYWKYVGKNLVYNPEDTEFFDHLYMMYCPDTLTFKICQFFL